MDSKKERGIGSLAFAYFDPNISRPDAIRYWRGKHGWLVSQQEGCSTYRQLKFDDQPLLNIPNWAVDMYPEPQFIPDGAAETFVPTYLRAAKVMLSDNRKKIYLDERNFLRQVFLYATQKSNCIWAKDALRHYDAETGIADGERILLCLKGKRIRALILQTLPQLALDHEEVLEIHAYYFMKYNENLWKSVDVNHVQPEAAEYQGALLLGAKSRQTVLDFLNSDAVSNAINTSTAEAVHAFGVEAVTVMRQDDKRSLKAINGRN